MYRARRLIGFALGVALLAALALAEGAVAQEADPMELQLTPSRDSGVSGTATITEEGEGVRVELSVEGLPKEGIEHINHFHAGGTCTDDRAGDPAPATIPLKTIVADADGTGSASTTLRDVTMSQLFDPGKKRYVALHAETEEGQGVPPVISCADVVEAAGAGAVSTELPESGGMNLLLVLLTLGASFFTIAIVIWVMLARRRMP
jgi:Cu/Zn superoxide dismutase